MKRTKGRESDRPKYYLFPSSTNPKYALLANSYGLFKKGASFYRPISLKALIKKKLLLLSYPFLPLIKGKGIYSDELLEKWALRKIKKLSEGFGMWGSFYLPPGNDKIIVQLLNGKEDIFAYMKIGLTERGNEWITREREALNFLKSAGFSGFEFPSILERGREDDKEFIVLSTPSRLLAPRKISLKAVLPGFRELFNLQGGTKKLRDVSHLKEMLQRIEEKPSLKELKDILHEIIEEFGDLLVPVGCLHYDFKTWNIFINPKTGKFFVIDWEFFRKEGLPLWDVFTFIIQPLLLVKYYGKAAAKIISEFRNYYPLLEGETMNLALKKELLPSLLALYFIDMASFLENYGHRDIKTREAVKKMAELAFQFMALL